MNAKVFRRAVILNHRSWFGRQARVAGGKTERFGTTTLAHAGAFGAIVFEGTGARAERDLDALVGRVRQLALRNVGAWSRETATDLGVRLVARGFEWGWRPNWMAAEMGSAPAADPRHEVVVASGPYPDDLPNLGQLPDPPGTAHLAVVRDGWVVGHISVNPFHGEAGIYEMGVVPSWRRQGIGRALLLAGLRWAYDRGCSAAVLNATDEGERLYRTLGFRSVGHGQTWWLSSTSVPTQREVALAEAIGLGRLPELRALAPTQTELLQPLTSGTSPLRLAVVTNRVDVVAWLLDTAPELVDLRFEPFGGTILHLAVEWGRSEILRLALERGADLVARDRTWDATPLAWAYQYGRVRIGGLLRSEDSTIDDAGTA